MEIQKGIDIKDYLISIVSSSNGIDEPTVSKVVEWAFKEAKKEVRNQSSVEFTGFGTYLIYPSKHRKVKAEKEEMLGRLEKRIEENNPKDNIKYYKDILEVTKEFLEFLNKVEYEFNNRMDKTSAKSNKECPNDSGRSSELCTSGV